MTRILLTIAHASGSRGLDEQLRTDSAQDLCQYCGMMKKKNNSRESARTTIASIKREMEKPRLTESVRNHGRDEVEPVAEKPTARPARV
jgi:hypothetical protein